MDETLMIDPPPTLRISGMAYFVPRNTPLACTSICASHTATVVSSTVNRAPVPALLTRTCSLPKVAMVVWITSCHSSSLVTSCRTNKASPPLARICSAVLKPISALISVNTTLAPSRAKSRAAAPPKPMSCPSTPAAAPVISATFPASRIGCPPVDGPPSICLCYCRLLSIHHQAAPMWHPCRLEGMAVPPSQVPHGCPLWTTLHIAAYSLLTRPLHKSSVPLTTFC